MTFVYFDRKKTIREVKCEGNEGTFGKCIAND